ncbi:MAG: biotin--[acetyl-CoA-carboxylase] ligase, partial [Candidatus Aminicenantes bacterium]|nr:biotin--[acetyl-CoA-carboxylase] ligase [Candidatus Aminicenantes bacterium]
GGTKGGMKIGDPIHFLPTCTSTNDVVKDMAAHGAPEGTVVIAEEQTSGKGRYQRHWFSSCGKGLYISVLLRPPQPEISLLTLSAGLAVAEALWNVFGVKVCLKWPNDLLWEGKKLGGILSESSFIGNHLNHVVVGIGLNINHNKKDFPEGIRETSISLKQIKHKDVDKDLFLQNLWKVLEIWYDFYVQKKTDLIIASFMESSCYSPGQKLIALTDKGAVLGTFKRVDQRGGVVLETRDGVNTYFAVDIKSLQEAKEN